MNIKSSHQGTEGGRETGPLSVCRERSRALTWGKSCSPRCADPWQAWPWGMLLTRQLGCWEGLVLELSALCQLTLKRQQKERNQSWDFERTVVPSFGGRWVEGSRHRTCLGRAALGGLYGSGVGKVGGNSLSVSSINIFFDLYSILGLRFSILTF